MPADIDQRRTRLLADRHSPPHMIVLITRTLLLLQAGVALAIGFGLASHWPALPLWIARVIGLGCVVCMRALITANNFRLASRFRGDAPHEPIGWRRGLRLFAQEFRATMESSSWSMPFCRIAGRPVDLGSRLPVLLIHGYGCNSGYWWRFSRSLREAAISFHAVDLEPVLGSIDGYVPQVDAAIDALRAATGRDRVVIVAHSMGGLVACAWVRRHADKAQRVAALITLGTPHDGTGLAQFGIGENSRQMRRVAGSADTCCSDWLAALQAHGVHRHTALVSIYSQHDNIIAPAESSHVQGAKNIALPAVGHVALASDPTVTACLLAEIRAAMQDETGVASTATTR